MLFAVPPVETFITLHKYEPSVAQSLGRSQGLLHAPSRQRLLLQASSVVHASPRFPGPAGPRHVSGRVALSRSTTQMVLFAQFGSARHSVAVGTHTLRLTSPPPTNGTEVASHSNPSGQESWQGSAHSPLMQRPERQSLPLLHKSPVLPGPAGLPQRPSPVVRLKTQISGASQSSFTLQRAPSGSMSGSISGKLLFVVALLVRVSLLTIRVPEGSSVHPNIPRKTNINAAGANRNIMSSTIVTSGKPANFRNLPMVSRSVLRSQMDWACAPTRLRQN